MKGKSTRADFNIDSESENEAMDIDEDNKHYSAILQPTSILKNSQGLNKAMRTKTKRHDPADLT